MLSILEHPLFWALILPFTMTAALLWALRATGVTERMPSAAGLTASGGYLAAVLAGGGIPPFPPPIGVGALTYAVVGGGVIGVLVDQWVERTDSDPGLPGWAITTVFAFGCGLWAVGMPATVPTMTWAVTDMVPALMGALVIALRLRRMALTEGTAMTSVAVVMAGAGLTIVSLIAGFPAETGLAAAVAAAALGLLVWNWPRARDGLSLTFLLPIGAALTFLAVRLAWHTPVPYFAIAILGMVLFADATAYRLAKWMRAETEGLMPLFLALTSLLPILLAVASTVVGIRM